MNPALVTKHLVRALAGFLLVTMLAAAAGGYRGAMAAQPPTPIPVELQDRARLEAFDMGANARMSGRPLAPPSILTPEGREEFMKGWNYANEKSKERGFRTGWKDYKAGRDRNRVFINIQGYGNGWDYARSLSREAAYGAGEQAFKEGRSSAAPKGMSDDLRQTYRRGWEGAERNAGPQGSEKAFKAGIQAFKEGRSSAAPQGTSEFMQQRYRRGWEVAQQNARLETYKSGWKAFEEGRSSEAPKGLSEDLRRQYQQGWWGAWDHKAKKETSKQDGRVGSYQDPNSRGGGKSGWQFAVGPLFERRTSRNYLAAPLTLNNNNIGANLFNLNTDTNGVGGSIDLSYRFRDLDFSFAGTPWTTTITAGFQGSTGGTSTSLPLITVSNPFNAVLPAIDGSQVFNLFNNIQNVRFEFDSAYIGGSIGVEAQSAINNATSWRAGLRFGIDGRRDTGSLRFLNGNIQNNLESILENHAYRLTVLGGPVIHINEQITFSMTGNVGLGVLDSDLSASQTVGNQTFTAKDSDVKFDWSAGFKLAIDWRPVEELPLVAGAFFSYRYIGARPVVDFGSALGQRTRIGYRGGSEFRVGIGLGLSF